MDRTEKQRTDGTKCRHPLRPRGMRPGRIARSASPQGSAPNAPKQAGGSDVAAVAGAPRCPQHLARRPALRPPNRTSQDEGRTCGITGSKQRTSGLMAADRSWHRRQVKTTAPQAGRMPGRCGPMAHDQRKQAASAPAARCRGHWWGAAATASGYRGIVWGLWPGPGFAGWT